VGKQENHVAASSQAGKHIETSKGKTRKAAKVRNQLYEVQGVAQDVAD
jgi:hypothetical protein